MELHLELALVKLKDAIRDFQTATQAVVSEIDNVIGHLPQNRVEQWRDNRQEPLQEHVEVRPDQRVGYSVIRWSREDTGVYVAQSAKGTRLKVYSEGRGQWYAQVGDVILNEDKPLPQKAEAVSLVEDAFIRA